jgi:hypothetical protein
MFANNAIFIFNLLLNLVEFWQLSQNRSLNWLVGTCIKNPDALVDVVFLVEPKRNANSRGVAEHFKKIQLQKNVTKFQKCVHCFLSKGLGPQEDEWFEVFEKPRFEPVVLFVKKDFFAYLEEGGDKEEIPRVVGEEGLFEEFVGGMVFHFDEKGCPAFDELWNVLASIDS